MSVVEQMACPGCSSQILYAPGFVAWCQACDWNVDPTPPRRLSWRERRAAKSSARKSRSLFDELITKGVSGPPPRSLAINLVAAAVHLLTAVCVAIGLLLLIDGFGWLLPIRIVLGALALGTAAVVQPFWHPTRTRRSKLLTRDHAPTLFALVDEVAATLGCKGLDGIRVSTDFNASIQHTRSEGWVMTLGLALWSVLSPQERVALVAHELGHQLNHDQRNGVLVHGAAFSMSRWAYLLTPPKSTLRPRGRVGPSAAGLTVLGEMLVLLLLLPLAAAAAGLAWLLDVLAGRQGLAAEYYADSLAAKAAGTEAAVSALERLLLAEACFRRLHQVAKFDKAADPWAAVAAYAASFPAGELERQRRLGRLRLPAINSEHPPTQLRADLVRSLPYETAKVVMDSGQAAGIERELAGPVGAATQYLRSLYPR